MCFIKSIDVFSFFCLVALQTENGNNYVFTSAFMLIYFDLKLIQMRYQLLMDCYNNE